MNMKKSLIALAVAGVFAAPAFAATSNVDVYGIINIAIEDTDGENTGGKDDTVSPGVVDNYSRIGFKGSEDLGGGLKALWQVETQLSSGPDAGKGVGNTSTWANRNTFIGLAGGFGTVLAGRHDTPYKLGTASLDIFADTIGDYNLGRTDNVQLISKDHDARSGSAIAYISPTWSGFHFAVAVVAADQAGGVKDDKTMDALSATAVYANGPLFASLSYQDLGDAAGGDADNEAIKVGVSYTFGDLTIGGVYETIDTGDAKADRDSWLANVKYNMGPMVLKAQYGQVDQDVKGGSSQDQDAWAIGLDYNLSKRTTAYIVYAAGDDDNDKTNGGDIAGWNIGMKHSF
jgi:predicted porin